MNQNVEIAVEDTSQNEGKMETLSTCVERRIHAYFQDLNGQAPSANLYQTVLSQVEAPLLKIVLERTNGNRVKASELLGISRSTLIKKLKSLDI